MRLKDEHRHPATRIRQFDKKRMELHLHPYSYTGLKIVHDRKIQEALDDQRLYAGQERQRQGLIQTIGTILARFNNQSARKQEKPFPSCP